MAFDVKDRGRNTEQYWSSAHKSQEEKWAIQERNNNVEPIVKTNWYHYNYVFEDIRKNLSEIKYNKILDIGCGPNLCLLYYASKFIDTNIKFFGMDFTDTCVEFYGKNKDKYNKDFVFIKQDILVEPPKEDYDYIMMMQILEHIEPETNFKVLDSVLERCVYLYLSVPLDRGGNSGEHISFYDVNTFDKNYKVLAKEWFKNLYLFKLRGKL